MPITVVTGGGGGAVSWAAVTGKPADFTPSAHTHGNVTNDGKIGSTANLPVITTTAGALTTGSFGTAASTFCQGNDSRLSDSRTPVAHKTSHATGGTDALSPADIGAAAASHSHAISDVTNLQTSLNTAKKRFFWL